jgi:hypothetical protein
VPHDEVTPIYQRRADAPPDADFEPGALRHLVPGNHARLLDPRRTPVSIVRLRPETGTFILRIDDFEDVGARWEVELEKVDRYQFARGEDRASDADVARFRAAIARLDRTMTIACDPEARAATRADVARARADAAAWLEAESRFVAEAGGWPDVATRRGDERLFDDLARFMETRDALAVEEAFARQYVSNPHSGDLVKGHRIVIAEMGLAAYEGHVPRHPDLFDGGWSRADRRRHVTARLGFVQAMLAHLLAGRGGDRIAVHRGLSTETPLMPDPPRTFVSATFSPEVARSHFEAGTDQATGLLMRQSVPIERVFMTYLETAAMNTVFLEAEAVLLDDSADCVF